MITKTDIRRYAGPAYQRGDSFIYLPAHPLLRPFIANYTLTFPSAHTMPAGYTVLPTASSTLIVRAGGQGLLTDLSGVVTHPVAVGARANRMHLLLLVEFHPGGLYPFVPIGQNELVDTTLPLGALGATLERALHEALLACATLPALIGALDGLFLSRLNARDPDTRVLALTRGIVRAHGQVEPAALAHALGYSPKHVRRLFLRHVGASPKAFARIARVNYALRLMAAPDARLADVAAQAGYFDQPHLIHDFQSICAMPPRQYLQNRSVFYNDPYKM